MSLLFPNKSYTTFIGKGFLENEKSKGFCQMFNRKLQLEKLKHEFRKYGNSHELMLESLEICGVSFRMQRNYKINRRIKLALQLMPKCFG